MKISKAALNIIFSCVIFVLVGALVCSAVVIKQKNDKLKAITTQISENEETIEKAEKKISEYEAKIAEKDKTNTDITAQLEAAKAEKQKLEKENAALKEKIKTLSAEAQKNYVSPQAASPTANKVCYLTFDDGPSDNTLKILDILKKYNAKATFFVVGTGKLDYIKRIHAEGHTVGLHTNTHQIYQRSGNIYLSTDAYFADLKAVSDKVEKLIGVKSMVIRFPGGSSNKISKSFCSGIMTQLTRMVGERGYSYFDWNVSSNDAAGGVQSSTYIKNSVLNGAGNKSSICVLMHDTSAKSTTVGALPGMIEGLIAKGYRFEALKAGDYGFHHGVNN